MNALRRRSPSTLNIGAARRPRSRSEPKVVSRSTDPVPTITYQPRISVSISKAPDVRRSAGHGKRKLRTRSGAKVNDRSVRVIAPRAWDAGSRSARQARSGLAVRVSLRRMCAIWVGMGWPGILARMAGPA
jgi:hypothetical protein